MLAVREHTPILQQASLDCEYSTSFMSPRALFTCRTRWTQTTNHNVNAKQTGAKKKNHSVRWQKLDWKKNITQLFSCHRKRSKQLWASVSGWVCSLVVVCVCLCERSLSRSFPLTRSRIEKKCLFMFFMFAFLPVRLSYCAPALIALSGTLRIFYSGLALIGWDFLLLLHTLFLLWKICCLKV